MPADHTSPFDRVGRAADAVAESTTSPEPSTLGRADVDRILTHDSQIPTPAVAAWADLLRQTEDERDAAQALAIRLNADAQRDLDHARVELEAARGQCQHLRRELDTMRAVAASNRRHAESWAQELERWRPVVDAARAWRARITSPPNAWADDEDFALIAAVDALTAEPAAPVPAPSAPEPLRARLAAAIGTALTPCPDVCGCPGTVARLAADAALTVLTPPDPDRIAQAIGDPGSIVGPRRIGWRDVGDGGPVETFEQWAARAVLHMLAETAAPPAVDHADASAGPPEGQRTDAGGPEAQGDAEGGAWEHTDPHGDTITIEPRGETRADGWYASISPDVECVHLTPDAAADLHAWLGQQLGHRDGYEQATAILRDITGSPAARWAADYLTARRSLLRRHPPESASMPTAT